MASLLKIKKRTIPEWLTLFVFVMPFVFSFLIQILHVPSFIKYTVDAAWLVLFFILLFRKRTAFHKKVAPLFVLVIVFFLYCFVLYFLHFQSPFYFLWGMRNNFRFYVAFFAFLTFFDEDDVNGLFRSVDILFWINTAVTLVQYFAFDYHQDCLGGIFGVEKGANAYSIILLTMVVSRSLLQFMSRKESVLSCVAKCASALLIAALAELKFFFVAFLIILVMAAVFTSFSWKKVLILAFGGAMVTVFSSLLMELFHFDNFLSLERLWELATQENYSSSETVNRLSAIPVLSRILVTDIRDQIFGLGLGNCDTSAFAICETPFHQQYSYLSYNWFSCAFLFLEVGYIGLLLYSAFFVLCFIAAWRLLKQGKGVPLFCQMGMVMSVMCFLFLFYNSSLRAEAGYMVFFVLALPFIKTRDMIYE